LEGEATTEALTGAAANDVVAAARAAAERVRAPTGEEPALLLADHRFAWAHALASAAVARETVLRSRTERLDDVLTSRWLGLPIFLGLMWMVFTLVTDVAGPFVDWTDGLVTGPVAALVRAGLSALGLGGTWVAALLVDGVLGGVGSVLVFVPVLAVLYLALGLLEDSGYMARAAFLLDRLMRPIGLTGKSFLPLLLGFGCNVPGVYATRVLDRRRDRIVTTLLLPFVSCAARLPVYVLLAAIFFPGARGAVVFTMYVASIAVVLLVGAFLDRVLMRSERNDSFILELPAYRRPSRTILWRYTSERVKSFVARAGTVIFGCSMLVWLLLAVPVRGSGSFADTHMEDSAFAGVARVVSPALAPAGLDSWQVAGTLVSGFVAKEVVVSTMDQTYGGHADSGDDLGVVASLGHSARSLGGTLRDAGLAVPRMVGIHIGQWHHTDEPAIASAVRSDLDRSSSGHGSLAAAALLVIVLLYVPCMATVAAIRHEIGGRWAATSVALNLSVAWIAGTMLFQLGRLMGLG
jgi:ferrous iron transport protein B